MTEGTPAPGAGGAAGAPALPPDPVREVLVDLAVAAAGIGTWDWDLVSGRLLWDPRLVEMFGYRPETFDETLAAFTARVHPDDRERVHDALATAVARCGEYAAEYRVVLPDGDTRWISARGRVLGDQTGTAVRALGAAIDTTAESAAEARVARVLETMTSAFFSLDREWRFAYVNSEAERVLGRTREELLGGDLWDLFPAAVGSEFDTRYRRAVTTGATESFEAYYPAPLDAWFEVRAWPGPDGLAVYFSDITARHRAEEAARAATRRAELVAAVTVELTETLDGEDAVARLAQLVVPTLADWCIVTSVDEDATTAPGRGLHDIASWHADPALRPLADRYSRIRPDALLPGGPLVRALRTGRPVVVRGDATPHLQESLVPGEARDLVALLAPDTKVVLPLRGRGRTVGLLSLFTGAGRTMSEEDVRTAREVAGRAGLALDNSRLYREQRRVAESLQRSLLTAPPEPDHLQIAVRYVPAAESAQVGGDWYDAFLQRSGDTVLVIGDVVGHDIDAAAAMGQLRSLLRGIAVATGEGPAGLLREVDLAVRTLQLDVTATAVVARVEQTPDERAAGRTRVRWSTAGHPPPVVVRPDGSAALLAHDVGDLLLGVLPDTDRHDHEAVVERGSTLLLYTDGLVERRTTGLRPGLEALVDAARAGAHLDLESFCDHVLSRLLPDRPDDDVALVAVRLHPQDEPRPPEAGPVRVPEDVPADG